MQDGLLSRIIDRAVANARAIAALAAADKRLSAANNEPIEVEKRSRDPRSLYDGNTPIAQVQDPKIDLDQKKVKFPSVSAGVILQAKLYEFQN